jgi:iron uptake system EfeUOB component EfeO/EfeM
MKPLIEIANQLHSLEKKIEKESHSSLYTRHIQRMRQALQEMGISYHSPEGEKYSETRTDVEANITGTPSANMKITEVIKPIVMQNNSIIQAGIVIVEG